MPDKKRVKMLNLAFQNKIFVTVMGVDNFIFKKDLLNLKKRLNLI
jgi:hypothetical protein